MQRRAGRVNAAFKRRPPVSHILPCKLCLLPSDEHIGILSDEGRRLNIDSTLTQHFRFEFDVNMQLKFVFII